MFLTANHPNPLTAQLTAAATGTPVTWPRWAAAAAVPGLVSLLVIPAALWLLQKPSMRDSRPARDLSRKQLAEMGPLSRQELVMAGTSCLTLVLWIGGAAFGEKIAPHHIYI